MQTASIPAADRPSMRGRSLRSRFYVGVAAFMSAIVLVGFWPTYFGPALRGQIARPWIIQLHGLVFVGWMVLLMAQVLLASRGQLRAHRKLGAWGIAYGSAVIVMGVIAGVAAPVMHLSAGEWTRDRAAGFLLITLGDMVLFGSLFAAAIAYRRRPETHKRLMVAATVALLFAAVGRMSFIQSPLISAGVWLSPMFVLMAYDWKHRGRVHLVCVIATAWLFVGALRALFVESEAWLPIGRAILSTFV
jgi:hypothetical protein